MKGVHFCSDHRSSCPGVFPPLVWRGCVPLVTVVIVDDAAAAADDGSSIGWAAALVGQHAKSVEPGFLYGLR